MTVLRALAVFGRVLLVVVLAASGFYVLLYLWRWEWERAQIAGVFFLASLIVMSTQLVLRRIADVSSKPVTAGSTSLVSTVAPPRPFAWTDPDRTGDESTYVFLPVLLGFGVALSALAAVAERLVAFAVGAPSPTGSARPARGVSQRVIGVVLVLVLVGTGALLLVARHRLMTAPEALSPGTRTYVLEVTSRGDAADVGDSLETLAVYCRDRAHVESLTITDVSATSADDGVLTVEPVLGRLGSARFEGCLVDAVLDRRVVTLIDVRTDLGDAEVTGLEPPSDS